MGRIFDLGINNPNYEINYNTDPYDKQVDFVFLNTCGFISSGREEMISTMNDLIKKGKKVYLLGCGLQYFKTLSNAKTNAPLIKGGLGGFKEEIKITKDIFHLSRSDFENITIAKLLKGYNSPDFKDFKFTEYPRAYTNAEFGFEYLKIAEGCDNHCTFCIIPKLRGKQKSLPIEKIINEIYNMLNAGIQEIILIAQDTTTYGRDLYGESKLFELLEEIEKIDADFQYRLLYLYPDIITIKELKRLTRFKKFIPYFDIPLQHISSPILKRMGRFYDEKKIYQLLDFIKKEFPNSFIRTNFIIGFPGEEAEDNQKLLEFINLKYFDNIALFEYHDEPFATSSKLDKKVPDTIIRKRFTEARQLVNRQLLDREDNRKGKEYIGYIMDIQTNLSSLTKEVAGMKGTTEDLKTLITVRPQLHAPEIDPYDEIKLEQITGVFEDKDLEIGDKIVYKI
ncbi:MiaB/RimO family radical SAM methylthiotransferase [Candidatus Gracilibacteria bacterium]|nr:MiaB/RimO family radical SAM methylthiotransferase [Candidatus Gracilibacteria bacterium]